VVLFLVAGAISLLFLLWRAKEAATVIEKDGRLRPADRQPAYSVRARPGLLFPDVLEVRRGTDTAGGNGEPRNQSSRAGDRIDPDVIPGEFVLSFFSSGDQSAFIELALSKGIQILDITDFGYAVRVRVSDRTQLDRVIQDGPIPLEYSSNYYVLSPELKGRDPKEPESGYRAFGNQSLQWLGVTDDHSLWGDGITVAVLDTGVDLGSGLSREKVTRIKLAATEASESVDYKGHGTAVASLIAGSLPGVQGIAPASSILSIQVLSEGGVGDAFTLARGIVEAVNSGVRIINLCLGTYGNSFILKNAVDFALQKDVAIVAATGNDAVEGVVYPARYEGVLAVSAVDAAGRHLYFANRGAEVDLAAPGLGVNAAWQDERIVAFSGTSAAVPFVSGAMAALLSENPEMSAADAEDILCGHSDDAGAPGMDYEFGNGILNIRRVMNRDVAGIYDASVGGPYVPPQTGDDEALEIVVYAQNRGTENLDRIDLKVEIGGVSKVWNLYDVGVGRTMSRKLRVSRTQINESGIIDILSSVVIGSAKDANPGNNVSRTVIFSDVDSLR